jgi:ABC-2 type transport system ATP-binding protein
MLLHIENLSKHFGSRAAIDGIHMDLGAGERLALVGHNGSGKTTLIRCILGLHRYSGRIELLGHDLRVEREQALGQVGFVPQIAPALRATVDEYLQLAKSLSGAQPQQVKALAERMALDLNICAKTPFYKLSGGMKQKLLIAVALARRPALLIFDEPTASLDPPARRIFFEMLAEVADETAVLISSHRTDELVGVVTRLVELDSGHITMDETFGAGRNTGSLMESFRCSIRVNGEHPSLTQTLIQWGFATDLQSHHWSGLVAASDRFRFLTTLARWSSVIRNLEWKEMQKPTRLNGNVEENGSCEKSFFIL